jgi:hypothetical protein
MAMRWPPRTTLLRVVPPRTARRCALGTLLAPHSLCRSAAIIAASTCLPHLDVRIQAKGTATSHYAFTSLRDVALMDAAVGHQGAVPKHQHPEEQAGGLQH